MSCIRESEVALPPAFSRPRLAIGAQVASAAGEGPRRARRRGVGGDARLHRRARAGQGSRRRLRADLVRRGGAGDPGDRRRPVRSRHRHALRGDPEGEGPAPRHLPDVCAGLLPGRLDRIRELEGSRRPALRLQFPRLGHRGLWRRDGGARRDQVQRAHLRVGLRQSRHRADERAPSRRRFSTSPTRTRSSRRRRDKFHVLPGVDEKVSDEILFANAEWLAANQETATIVVEELLKLWREMNENPGHHRGGAGEAEPARRPAGGSDRGGSRLLRGRRGVRHLESARARPLTLAKADFKFYVDAGQLEGPAESLKVEDYWDLSIIEAAKKNIGG